jgi:hypothetical protein
MMPGSRLARIAMLIVAAIVALGLVLSTLAAPVAY